SVTWQKVLIVFIYIKICRDLEITDLKSFYFLSYSLHPHLHSFPTRRSSDLTYTYTPHLGDGICEVVYWRGEPRGKREFTTMDGRSEEHTSELQSRGHRVCRLLLEKKNYADAQ